MASGLVAGVAMAQAHAFLMTAQLNASNRHRSRHFVVVVITPGCHHTTSRRLLCTPGSGDQSRFCTPPALTQTRCRTEFASLP